MTTTTTRTLREQNWTALHCPELQSGQLSDWRCDVEDRLRDGAAAAAEMKEAIIA